MAQICPNSNILYIIILFLLELDSFERFLIFLSVYMNLDRFCQIFIISQNLEIQINCKVIYKGNIYIYIALKTILIAFLACFSQF